ncbi:Glycerol-3-phosphate regulon repressor [subsurface metagenome]
MNKNNRFTKILEILKTEGNASTKYLAGILQISEATIRRDLAELAGRDNFPIERVHGGAIYSLEKSGLEPMFNIKLSRLVEEKKKIARLAVNLVEDGDVVILDSGTTTYYLASELVKKKGLKIITTDVKIAEKLARYPTVQTILIGGEVRAGYFSIGGEIAIRCLGEFKGDKGFLSTDGWDLSGTYNASMFEVGIKRSIIQSSMRTYLIADHTKYGKVALIKVADIEKFEAIIIDESLPEDVLKNLEEKKIKIIF